LHVGLKGTMSALFLKDLADKTRRGLRGRISEGRSAGGVCYGYKVLQETDGRGEPVRGGRRIIPPRPLSSSGSLRCSAMA
jgi:site-specific DNA recombinase